MRNGEKKEKEKEKGIDFTKIGSEQLNAMIRLNKLRNIATKGRKKVHQRVSILLYLLRIE